jgi:hypothetical protein
MPSSLANTTITTAVSFAAGSSAAVAPQILSLTHEVLKSMSLMKWHVLGALVVTVTLTGGTIGLVAVQADDNKKKPLADGSKPAVVKDGEKPKKPVAGDTEKPKPNADTSKPKPGGDGEKKPGTRVTGRVGSVDAAAGTVTIGTKTADKGKTEQTFKLASDAQIRIDGKPGKLADLPAGANIEVLMLEDAKEASVVNAMGPRTGGTIAKVDGSTITLEPRGEEAKQLTSFVLAVDANIFLEGRKGTAADLKPGMQVGMQIAVDNKTVLVMKVGGPGDNVEKPKKPDAKPDGEKKPVAKPDGDKKPGAKPDGEKKPGAKPDGEKKPGQE